MESHCRWCCWLCVDVTLLFMNALPRIAAKVSVTRHYVYSIITQLPTLYNLCEISPSLPSFLLTTTTTMKTLHIWDLALLAATCTSALSIPSKHEGYDFTPEMYDMEQIIMEPLNKLEEMLDGAASTVGKVVDSVFPPVPPPGSPPPRNHEDETIYQIIEKSDK